MTFLMRRKDFSAHVRWYQFPAPHCPNRPWSHRGLIPAKAIAEPDDEHSRACAGPRVGVG